MEPEQSAVVDGDGKTYDTHMEYVIQNNPTLKREFDDMMSQTDATAMTHQPEQANTAKPYVDLVKAFASGGLHDALTKAGVEMPEWSNQASEFFKKPEVQEALGIMGGVGAKTYKVMNLAAAKQMMHEGADAQKVWDQTGWYLGADNRWKFEINDVGSKINHENLTHVGGDRYSIPFAKSQKLGDILDHPELYKAYPQLKDISVAPEIFGAFTGVKGGYGTVGVGTANERKVIRSVGGTLDDIHNVIIHETQHAVQDIEGFAPGGNQGQFISADKEALMERTKEMFKSLDKEVEDYLDRQGTRSGKYLLANMHDAIANEHWASKSQKDLVQKAKDLGVYEYIKNKQAVTQEFNKTRTGAFQKYQELGGEVEARNVQKRLKDFVTSLPTLTEDIPRDKQIVPVHLKDLPPDF